MRSPLVGNAFLWIVAITMGLLQNGASAVDASSFVPTTVTLSQCISYNATTAAGSVTQPDGSTLLSTLLVGDEVGPPVGAVEVHDLSIKHGKLGALMISLHWLPYAEEVPAMNPRELEEAANRTVILKDTRQGGSGSNIASVTFTDVTNATIPTTSTSNLNGTFRPYTPLTTLSVAQLPSRGRWVLAVEDTGSNRKNRTIQLLRWSLVVCPRSNTTLPTDLQQTMIQGAGFDLSAALGGGGGGLFAAAGGSGGGVGGLFKAAAHQGGGRTLLPAVGTLVTVEATTNYKTYSDLADQAVDSVVGAADNIQKLFGLPREKTPLIDRWLPWVELLIGGTDLTLQNKVWPGKIVLYALQLEVFVRMREAMSAPGNTTSGGAGGNATTGAAAGNSTSISMRAAKQETPNCGVLDGPYGPQVINKKLLQREMCRYMMPIEMAQYAQPGAINAQSPSTSGAATNVNLRSTSNPSPAASFGKIEDENIIELPERPGYDGPEGGRGRFPFSQPQRRLQHWAQSSQSLALGTDLTPMSFVPGPAFEAAGGVVSMPREAQEALEGLSERFAHGQQDSSRNQWFRPPEFDGMAPDPEAVNRIVRESFEALDMESFHRAMEKQLDIAVERSQNTSDLLDRAQKHPELQRRGGRNATKAAEALKTGVDTQKEALKAARDMVKRFSQKELRDEINKWMKEGGLKKEMDGQRNASNANRMAIINRFVFNFQRVRLTFRFSAKDGFQFSFIQWIYDLADVQTISTLAKQLQTLDDAQSGGKNKRSQMRKDAQNAIQLDDKRNRKQPERNGPQQRERNGPKEREHNGPQQRERNGPQQRERNSPQRPERNGPQERERNSSQENEHNDPQRQRGRMSTGETPDEFMARVTAQARATAMRALSRIPPSSTVGPGRMPTTGNVWGG